MADLLLNRLTAIWLLLIGATLFSVEVLSGLFLLPGNGRRTAAIAVVVVAVMKVRFVGLDFMELRRAPTFARLGFQLWLTLLCAALIAIYLTGIGP